MSEMLRTRKLCKTYDNGIHQVSALTDVDLSLKKGDFVAVMGPSGSGKTTLLNMLGCLDGPTSGTIRIDGVEVTSVKRSELPRIRSRMIGFIFQSYNLLPIYTAAENVELPMETGPLPKDQWRDRAKTLLQLVGLGDRMDHNPEEMSAGQKQRVAIARAFANDPAIILADEPTGNLDTATGDRIMELLTSLNRKTQKTIVMVTHDEDMADYADRVLYMEDGRIVD